MDNYSMNDYSLNDITLVDKKYYSELKRKAKAFDKLVELYPQKEEMPSDEFYDEMGYIIEECVEDER